MNVWRYFVILSQSRQLLGEYNRAVPSQNLLSCDGKTINQRYVYIDLNKITEFIQTF